MGQRVVGKQCEHPREGSVRLDEAPLHLRAGKGAETCDSLGIERLVVIISPLGRICYIKLARAVTEQERDDAQRFLLPRGDMRKQISALHEALCREICCTVARAQIFQCEQVCLPAVIQRPQQSSHV